MKIVIAGGCRCGKSTLAQKLATELKLPVFSFDAMLPSYDDMERWSRLSSDAASLLVDDPTPKIYEGVQSARVLRKALKFTDAAFVDKVIVLDTPLVAIDRYQAAMNKGCITVFAEIEAELARRGVVVQRGE